MLKHRLCYASRGRGRLCNAMATAASQFKCEVGPVGRDDNRRGMTGKQGEVKERERTVKKEKKKRKDKE